MFYIGIHIQYQSIMYHYREDGELHWGLVLGLLGIILGLLIVLLTVIWPFINQKFLS